MSIPFSFLVSFPVLLPSTLAALVSPTQATDPNATIQSNSSSSSKVGVEIPVTFETSSVSPNKKEKSSHSDFQSQKTGPESKPSESTAKTQSNFSGFNHSNLFDNYQSPFDLLNRGPSNNRGAEGSNSNVPFSAHFGSADADDFFNQAPIAQSSVPPTPSKNEKSSNSDFQQPKKVPDTSKQHSTTPTRSGTNLSNEQGTNKMGNSSSSSTSTAGSAANSGKKAAAGGYENSDFASPISRPNQPPHQASQPKTDEEKCNEIEAELNGLEQEVANFAGTKTSDRSYLKLEELLTRCLLKLDAIERGEERINQTRRRLINFTHQLSDRLESRATENETKAGGRGGVDTSSNSSEGEQPASKRSKSPNDGSNGHSKYQSDF